MLGLVLVTESMKEIPAKHCYNLAIFTANAELVFAAEAFVLLMLISKKVSILATKKENQKQQDMDV